MFDIGNPEATNDAFTPKMDSYFMAETLKYLYLLFNPEHLIHKDSELANKIVWTTEAHLVYTNRQTFEKYGENDSLVRKEEFCEYFDRNLFSFSRPLKCNLFPFMDMADSLGITEEVVQLLQNTATPEKKGHQLLKKFIHIYSPMQCTAIVNQRKVEKLLKTNSSTIRKKDPLNFPPSEIFQKIRDNN